MNWLKNNLVARRMLLTALLLAAVAPVGLAAKLVSDYDSVLMVALYRGDAKLAARALENGANPNACNSDGTTALVMAVLHSDKETVHKLIDRGADVNARTGLGRTPLIAAASVPGRWEMVKLLLEKGADPNLKGGDAPSPAPVVAAGGDTPLTEAAKSYDTRSLEILLDHGAKVNEADNVGNTPLLNAALNANPAAVKILLARGASLKAMSRLGMTPLTAAAMRNDREIVKAMLAAGANPRETDNGGSSALMWAAFSESGDPAVVDMLIRAGADVHAKNKTGESAMTWAKKNGDSLIADRLRKAGAEDMAVAGEKAARHDSVSADVAMTKALAVLQKASPEFAKVSGCVSCHHQTLPGTAARMARERGVVVDEVGLDKDMKRTKGFLQPLRPVMIENTDLIPDVQVSGSYLLWYFAEMGYPADATTEALVRNIALHQQTDGSWSGWAPRPPLEAGNMQATALAMRAIQLYGGDARQEEYRDRVARASRWLETAEAQADHQLVYQLLGLVWAQAPKASIDKVARRLLAIQRPDGGWGQLRTLDSDAYATGQVLYALHEAGVLKTTDAAYARGKQFLLETQCEDGSWLVKTRAYPVQPLKDTKFPHGRDQWISATGTSWAVMALAASDERVNYARVR